MITLLAAGIISLHRAFRVHKIAKKYNLISLKLDAKNSIKDGSASFVGFGSVLAGYFGIPHMDSIESIIIAGYIFFMAYVALKQSTFVLLDAVANPQLSDNIKTFVEKNFSISVSKVLLRPLGYSFDIEVHVRLDPNSTQKDSHESVKVIRTAIINRFKNSEVLVISYPIS